MPGSRNGRATLVTTAWNTALDVDVALGSLTDPCVPEIVVIESACTRMPSYFSRLLMSFTSVAAAVIVIGAGNGFPVESRVTEIVPPSSVAGGLFTSADGMNSCTVPPAETELPTAAAAGGALEVNTNTPSEVFGSASTCASGA